VQAEQNSFSPWHGRGIGRLSTWAFFSFDQKLKHLLVGYYLWQASLIAFALGSLAIQLRHGVLAIAHPGNRR